MTTVSSADLAGYLAAELRSTAQAMKANWSADSAVLRPLHKLQRWCEAVLTDTPADTDAVVPLYLLSRLLDDALENLTGDFRYDRAAHELRTTFFNTLTDDLGNLGEMGFADATTWLGIVQRALTNYLSVLEQLNFRAESQLTPTLQEGL